MFRNSRISRPLTALATLMALSVSGCAAPKGSLLSEGFIESIIVLLDGASQSPSDTENSIAVTNLVDQQTERFYLLAGGAMFVKNAADGSTETHIFPNTSEGTTSLSSSEFTRNDANDETGLGLYFEWEVIDFGFERIIAFNEAFRPEDLDPEQSGPFKSYTKTYGEDPLNQRKFSVVEPGEAILNLQYATFGGWSSASDDRLDAGFFFSGVPTGSESMPTTGSATYSGLTVGAVIDADLNVASLKGDMALSVNFADGSVAGEFTSMMKTASDGANSPWRDFSMAASINAGTDNFTGTTATNDGLLSGQAEGAFFGPGAAEVAGAWTLSGAGETAVGSFGGGQD